MRWSLFFSVLLTIIALSSVSVVYVSRNGVSSTCSSEYYQDYDMPGVHLTAYINNVSSTTRNSEIFNSIEGRITINNNLYHLSREQSWHYDVINRSKGMTKVTLIREKMSSLDTVHGTDVNVLLMGKPKEGRVARLWRLNHDIVLLGNPWSPLYSCVRI